MVVWNTFQVHFTSNIVFHNNKKDFEEEGIQQAVILTDKNNTDLNNKLNYSFFFGHYCLYRFKRQRKRERRKREKKEDMGEEEKTGSGMILG